MVASTFADAKERLKQLALSYEQRGQAEAYYEKRKQEVRGRRLEALLAEREELIRRVERLHEEIRDINLSSIQLRREAESGEQTAAEAGDRFDELVTRLQRTELTVQELKPREERLDERIADPVAYDDKLRSQFPSLLEQWPW